jgi:hypothetical protein
LSTSQCCPSGVSIQRAISALNRSNDVTPMFSSGHLLQLKKRNSTMFPNLLNTLLVNP